HCDGPSWGRNKARTRPTIGHVEGFSPGSATYWQYFRAAAGDSGKFYYSYDLGDWHIVVLNSGISTAAGSTQEKWLKADLAAHPPTPHTLPLQHTPPFSPPSGPPPPAGPQYQLPPRGHLLHHGAEHVTDAAHDDDQRRG